MMASMLFKSSPKKFSLSKRQYSTAKPTVGFIGLGNMGFSMASNLLKNGFPVIAFDISQETVKKLESKGAKGAISPKEVAHTARNIISMVPASPHVKEVYLGDNGVLKSAQEGDLFIDASTIDPHVAKELSEIIHGKGMFLLDAPVSGGVNGAAAGTLTFMVGGKDESLARARPFLEAMGAKIVHCGPNGCGQIVKVCNNLALAIEMMGISEAMNLGVKLGMEPGLMASIFNSSTSRCWSSDSYNPVPGVMPNVPASKGYEGGFGVDLMTKDLSLAINAAHSVKAPIVLGSSALQIYNMISTMGHGRKDFSIPFAFFNNSLPENKPQ